jgi:hypothetical protein
MRNAGGFYLRYREGLKPVLWRTASRNAAGPVTEDFLCTWLEKRDVENPYTTAVAVLGHEWTDELPDVLKDVNLDLVRGPPQ